MKKVAQDGAPELLEALDRGDVTVNAALDIARLPKEQQAELVKQGPEAVKQRAKLARSARSARSTPAPQRQPDPESQPLAPPAIPPSPAPAPRRSKLLPCGVVKANEAINALMLIPNGDPQRKRAFEMVTEWIDFNGIQEDPNGQGEAANVGIGLTVSSEAIDVLMRIPRNDPQRQGAFEKVRDWLDNNECGGGKGRLRRSATGSTTTSAGAEDKGRMCGSWWRTSPQCSMAI